MATTPNLKEAIFEVNDGSDVNKNCTDTNHDQWTYNYGTMLVGSATMYSIVSLSLSHISTRLHDFQTKAAEQEKWKARVTGLLDSLLTRFFPREVNGQPASENIMVEILCEMRKTCNPDQTSFKAYTSRWLAVTTQLAPFTASLIIPKLKASAKGAAQQCSGEAQNWCGQNWNSATWDGFKGVGEQMSALGVIQSTLIEKMGQPATVSTGGTPTGEDEWGPPEMKPARKITVGDRTGAAILTAITIMGIITSAWWMLDGD